MDRTERILVNSEAIAPRSPARPVAGGSGESRVFSVVVVAIAQAPLPLVVAAPGTPAWYSTLLAVSSMNASSSEAWTSGQLVQPDALLERDVAHRLRGHPADLDGAVVVGGRGRALGGHAP